MYLCYNRGFEEKREKKAVITKLPWREYENLLFETVDVF